MFVYQCSNTTNKIPGHDGPLNENLRNEFDSESELDEEREIPRPSPSISPEPQISQELDPCQHDEEDSDEVNDSHLENLRVAQQFLRAISTATLDDGKLDTSVLYELRNPQKDPPDELQNPDIRLSLDLFISCKHSSQKTYKSVCESIQHRFPEANLNLLSYYSANKMVAEISGVVSIAHDMCVNSCLAFVGPFKDLEACHICLEPRYNAAHRRNNTPVKQVCTIPLGPQIQALRRSAQGAAAMRYRDEKTTQVLEALHADDDQIYDDIFSGEDFLAMHERLDLTANDTAVMFSLDGAQLYQDKKSDTWIAVWIILDYNPKTRYKTKHVLPALIIPGPNKPKNLDSFMFRSFHHLSALQRENGGSGLSVWDAGQKAVIQSRVVFILGTADAVGLTEIDGRVGHHGAHGCRLGCSMQGRHKLGSGHYYAAHLRPHGHNNKHPDFDFRDFNQLLNYHEDYDHNLTKLLASNNQAEYEQNRKLTGLSKPSIISGLSKSLTLSVPKCFTVDLMHLLFLNLGELLISLWRGSLKCEPTDDRSSWDWAVLLGNVWQDHGKLVAAATRYFPSFFHRTPRNPAEKINSGYKATEYFLYVFGLGPAFFRTVLPQKYWINFCRLV